MVIKKEPSASDQVLFNLVEHNIQKGLPYPGDGSGRPSAVGEAARELGIPRTTARRKYEKMAGKPLSSPVLSYPEFAQDDVAAEDILDHMSRRYEQRQQYENSLNWFEVKVNENKPIGISWFGDPHIGSDGCNVPLLRHHCDLLKNTDGLYGANIGDTVDNWGGRLIREYANNSVDRKTERKLARWFLEDSGISWLLWLIGNHDVMDNAFAIFLKTIGASTVPMLDWRAKLKVTFPNKRSLRIDAAHDFKGHSMWNEIHSLDRAAVMDEHADFFVAGHRHDWATKQKELPDGKIATLLRVRGYKFIDDYAARLGYASKSHGASIMIILDPREGVFHPPYADLDRGVEFLKYLRSQ
tara:strand:- start:8744 stop:9808 length:1065 start_codon:yes stop_codon:yes gene_type:complete